MATAAYTIQKKPSNSVQELSMKFIGLGSTLDQVQ
jgi:hypothetical protein